MNMLRYSMNAFIPPHGELALFLQKGVLFVSKRAQGHMMDGGLEGSCGEPGEEQSYEGIQSEGGGDSVFFIFR
jgi:hypothetical protein